MTLLWFSYGLVTLVVWPFIYRWAYNHYKSKNLPWDDDDRNFYIAWSLFMAFFWIAILPLAGLYWFVTRFLGNQFKKLEK